MPQGSMTGDERRFAPTAASIATPIGTRSFVSGAAAGVVADSVLHPLDTINLRIKVHNHAHSTKYAGLLRSIRTILKEEGVRGYYAGFGTTLLSSPICAAAYFGTYETLKSVASNHLEATKPSKTQASMVYFASGACSELVISAVTVPTEVIKSRLQLGRNPRMASGGAVQYNKNYRNTLNALRTIVRAEGLRGLYSGYTACISVDTLYSACSFLAYETMKREYLAVAEKDRLGTVDSLGIGALAGGCAAFVSNPLDVVTVRLMTQGHRRVYNGLQDCMKATVKREGVRGLWKGGMCRMIHVMPSTGISFGVYETIKRWLYDGDLPEFDLDA